MPTTSSCDTCAGVAVRKLSVMVGAPVAGLLGRLATASVAALVSVSSFPASSVNDHLNLDGLALVGLGQGIGLARSSRYVGVGGEPLVAKDGVVEPVGVGYADGLRRERFPNLDDPGDGGHTRSRVIGQASNRIRCRAGQRLLVARVVGEGDLHPDRLALVGSNQGVGGVRRIRDVRVRRSVIGNPLIAV